jgi:hypothetical protein
VRGGSVYGATFRVLAYDTNDNKIGRVFHQLAQTSYQSLNVPYAHIGIDRSNNFLEWLNVGAAVNSLDSIKKFTPIIPNSHLVVRASAFVEIKDWEVQLTINPAKTL